MNFAKCLFLVLNCFETSSFPNYEFDLDGWQFVATSPISVHFDDLGFIDNNTRSCYDVMFGCLHQTILELVACCTK